MYFLFNSCVISLLSVVVPSGCIEAAVLYGAVLCFPLLLRQPPSIGWPVFVTQSAILDVKLNAIYMYVLVGRIVVISDVPRGVFGARSLGGLCTLMVIIVMMILNTTKLAVMRIAQRTCTTPFIIEWLYLFTVG